MSYRYIAEGGDKEEGEESTAAAAPEEDKPHDNYVNFDIAQTVLAKTQGHERSKPSLTLSPSSR